MPVICGGARTAPVNGIDIPAALAVTVGAPPAAPPNSSAHAMPYASVLQMTLPPFDVQPGCPATLFSAALPTGDTAKVTGEPATGAPAESIRRICRGPASPFATVSKLP